MMPLVRSLYARHRGDIQAYASMTGGSVGRLVLSLAYFIAVANSLTISEFGLFATASSAGVMISRALAFGFMSPLYRVATVKPLLVGTYVSGFLAAAGLSLPLIALLCAGIYLLAFAGDMAWRVFAIMMVAEIICWRGLETVVIVLNGLGRFGQGALLVIIGTGMRTLAALVFSWFGWTSLGEWTTFYLGANALSLAVGIVFFFPKVRLRWRLNLYLRRWRDSLSVAGAEILFYVQSEFDKIVVLAVGGPAVSGVYAIIMRLADLTALPVRSFNTLLVQRIMRQPALIGTWRFRLTIEAAIAAVSLAAIFAMALYLTILPAGLGRNVAEAAPYVMMILLVAPFRNLIEYHSELLYATGQTLRRMFNLSMVGAMKIVLLAAVVAQVSDAGVWAPLLNAIFGALYALSFAVTYQALKAETARAI